MFRGEQESAHNETVVEPGMVTEMGGKERGKCHVCQSPEGTLIFIFNFVDDKFCVCLPTPIASTQLTCWAE